MHCVVLDRFLEAPRNGKATNAMEERAFVQLLLVKPEGGRGINLE